MELISGIKTRRSVRKFTDAPIERETVEKIVEAATYAPSWKNTQIVRYNVISDRELIQKIADDATLNFVFNQKTMGRSTLLAVQSIVNNLSGYEEDGSFSTDKKNGWEMFDAGISAQTFCLAAHEYGIGTVILGIFDAEKIAEIIDLPKGETVSAVIAMGIPTEVKSAPPRKSVDEILRFK